MAMLCEIPNISEVVSPIETRQALNDSALG